MNIPAYLEKRRGQRAQSELGFVLAKVRAGKLVRRGFSTHEEKRLGIDKGIAAGLLEWGPDDYLRETKREMP